MNSYILVMKHGGDFLFLFLLVKVIHKGHSW
jgi:hypothetical protein